MATPGRRLHLEDWSPLNQTRIRASLEPREERLRLLKNGRTLLPKPLNLPSRQPPPSSRKESLDCPYESLREPEIVDVAPPGTWPRRESNNRRMKSPSIASQYSTRQSEISLGIIDFYMREPSPSLYSPELPPPIEQFDFGLPPTLTPSTAPVIPELPLGQESRDQTQPLIPISPPSDAVRPAGPVKGYSLFPVIKEVTPPPRNPKITLIDPLTPSQQPSPTYRPRKESLTGSGSLRSRADSLISRNLIPLRILSSDSSNSKRNGILSLDSTPSSTYRSPPQPQQSRWSDDTAMTSPPQAYSRTSFGSNLSPTQQYSFFEDDDDEDMPLRRKFAWKKKSVSSSATGSSVERRGSGWGWGWLFCGCGGRGR